MVKLPLNQTAAGANASAVSSKTYYKRPELGADSTALLKKVLQQEMTLKKQQEAVETAQAAMEKKQKLMEIGKILTTAAQKKQQSNPTAENAAAYEKLQKEQGTRLIETLTAMKAYKDSYAAYETGFNGYQKAVGTYNGYLEDQDRQYEAWKGTIRDAETVRAELEQIDQQIARLEGQDLLSRFGKAAENTQKMITGMGTGTVATGSNTEQLAQLKQTRALLQEEYDWGQLAQIADLKQMYGYDQLAEADRVTVRNMMELEKWSPEDRAALEAYAVESDAEFWQQDKANALPQLTAEAKATPLIEKYGAKRVAELAESWRRYKNQEASEQVAQAGREAASGGWADAGQSLWSIGANLVNAYTGPLGYLQELSRRTGQYRTLDPNNIGNTFSTYGGAVRGQVAENISGDKYDEQGNKIKDGGWLRQGLAITYEAGMSAADSLARIFVSGGNEVLSLGLAATGSFSQTVSQASKQGATPAQAIAMGLVDGGLEVLTEKVSLDNLFEAAAAGPKNIKQVVKGILLSGGIEVSEEEASFLGSLLAEAAILREKSGYHQRVQELMADGTGRDEAERIACRELLQEAAMTAVQSFLSGGMMGGGAQIANARNTKKTGEWLSSMGLDESGIEGLIDSGLESSSETESYQIAQELQKKVEAGMQPTQYELAGLYQANQAAIAEEAEAEQTEAPAQSEAVAGQNVPAEGRSVPAEGRSVPAEGQNVPAEGQNVPAEGQNVPAEGQNVIGEGRNVTGAPLSIAEQIRLEKMNQGGNTNVTERGNAGPAAAPNAGTGNAAGAGVLYGSGQRNDGAGAGEQAGSMGGGTGTAAAAEGTQGAQRHTATFNRIRRIGNLQLQSISSRELGLQSGTDTKSIKVVPEESWDGEMQQLAERVYQETGKRMIFVTGKLQIRGKDGRVRQVNGATHGGNITVRVDALKLSMEQIADHEAYHGRVEWADKDYQKGWLNEQIRRHITEKFSKEELLEVVGQYMDALEGVYGTREDMDEAAFAELQEKILEEVFADAYAGINAFGAGRFTSAVNEKMEQLGLSRYRSEDQENGVRKTTGPPNNDRYSIETLPDGKKYVRAERQVIFGNDPDSWSGQVEDYINGRIRRGQDVTLIAEDGDVLTITSTTAGKLADNHTSRGTTISDEEFYVKANAAVHIDELAKASRAVPGVTRQDVDGRHGEFASKGWGYRTAFFMDFDGKYYRLRISVAKNPDGTIVYNIGDVKERSFPTIDGSSAKGGALGGKTSFKESVPQAGRSVKERFSYAGEQAKTADSQTLAEAEELERQGADNETIRQETGWFRGRDGKWRFEVDDSTTQVAADLINYMTLGELLPGAEIFNAYPDLKDISVVFQSLDAGVNAEYDRQFDHINVNYKLKNDPEAIRGAVLHEIQHAIQNREGFSHGASVSHWERRLKEGFDSRKASDIREAETAEEQLKRFREEDPQFYRDMMELDAMAPDLPRGALNWDTLEQIEEDPPEWQAYDARRDQLEEIYGDRMWDFNHALYEFERINKRPARTAEELYWDTAGEIEARNVAGRRNLTAEERKNKPPILGGEDTVFAEGGWTNAAYDPETASIKEQLINKQNELLAMEPVAKVTVPENLKDKRTAYNWAVELLKPTGYRVERQGFGTIWFEKDDINYGLNYADSPEEKAALALLPRILKRGIEIGRHGNHKLRQKETVTFAAPAEVNGTRVNMAAVVTVRNGRYYTHRIVLPDGTVFKFGIEKNNDAAQEPHRGVPTKGSLANATSTASENIVTDAEKNVKRNTGERYSVDTDGDLDEEEYARRQERTYQGKPPTQHELEQERQAWLQREYNEKQHGKENKPTIAKRELRQQMMNLFSIPEGSRAELGTVIDHFADRLLKNGALTEADRKNFFDRMYDAGVMTVPAEDYFSEGRDILKGGRVYVPESVRIDFGDDWAEIRRRAFGSGIYFTSDASAGGIDMWNHELASQLPGLFDSEETDLRSILERIVYVAEEGRDNKMSLAEFTATMAGRGEISADEFLDHMERQMDWMLRTFAEKAELEIRLRDRADERVKREYDKGTQRVYKYAYKDQQRRTRERQARKEAAQRQRDRKELQELQKKTLKHLQWLNKNRNRAPEELRAKFEEVLSDIDIYAIGAANEMNWSNKYNASWKDLAQMYKDAEKSDPNFLPSDELKRVIDRLDGAKLEDMDLAALNDLYKAAVGLRTEFYNRNNVINDEMQRLFAEVYTDAKREIEGAPGKYTGKQLDKLLNQSQLTPMNVLQRMGGWDPNGTFYAMAKQLEKGERDMRAYSVKAQEMLQEFLTDHADWVKKADGQGKDGIWYKIEIPELIALELGKKPKLGGTHEVWMTPMQKVHLYLESKNVDNLRHMTGGRTFADKELYSKGERQEALAQGKTIRMAPETVKAIVSDLTEEEMELARLLERYYDTFATGEINRVSNILYGYDKAMGKNYAPIYTNQNYTKTEFGVFDSTAEGVGNLKGRQYAVNPSYNISAIDAFERHVDQTARFVGMAIPARNWTTLMNWREQNNSTADVISHKWGDEGKRYIFDLITTLQAGDKSKTDMVSSGIGKLQSTYITAIFGANPSIVLKQLGSIPLASAYLDAKNVPSPAQIKRIDRDLINRYTKDLQWRTMGYSMPETKQLKDNPNWTETNKFYSFTFGGGAITAMDGWAASTLWPWAENKVRRDFPELEMGTKEQIEKGESPFYKKVAELFEDAVARSQSTSDEIHQSSLRKSKNPLAKAFTMFRSDSAQTYNTLRQKIGEAQFYARTGATEKVQQMAKQAVGATFVSLLINAMWSEAINFLMALWKNKGKNYRDDEGELTFGSVAGEMASGVIGSFAGVVTGGEELLEGIGNVLTGEKIYDIETPGMEQLNDVITAVTAAGGTLRDVIAGAADVAAQDGDMGQYFKGHVREVLGCVKDLAETVVMYVPGLPVSGVPVSNIEAYLLGAVKWLSPELGAAYDDLFQSVSKNQLSGLSGDVLTGKMERILNDRGLEVSEETVQVIAQLYEAGEKTAFPSDVPTSVTIDEVKHTLSTYQQNFYGTVWNSVVSENLDALTDSVQFRKADQEARAKMLKKLYDFAAEQAKAALFEDYEISASTERVLELEKTGVDVSEGLQVGQADAEDYLELVEDGMDPEDAFRLTEELAELEPLDGEKNILDVQEWRVCVDFFGNPASQLSALYSKMTDAQFAKVELAYEFDVDPETYVRYHEIKADYDANGNGSMTNAEARAAIDSMTGLSNEQRAALWQIVTGAKSAKNNPYSRDVGQQVLDAKESKQ